MLSAQMVLPLNLLSLIVALKWIMHINSIFCYDNGVSMKLQTLKQILLITQTFQLNYIMQQPHSNVLIKFPVDQIQNRQNHSQIEENNKKQAQDSAIRPRINNIAITHINRWHLGSTILLNFFYLLMFIILPLSTVGDTGKILLIAFTFAIYIIYLTIAYSTSTITFMARLKEYNQYSAYYQKFITADCRLKFFYTKSRNNIDEQAKKYQQQFMQIVIVDRSDHLEQIDHSYNLISIKYNKKYYYKDSIFKGQIQNQFNRFIDKSKNSYDKTTRNLLRSKQKIQLEIEGLEEELGFKIKSQINYRAIFIVMYGFGFGAYLDLYWKDKVLRREINIVKEICPKKKQ